MDGSALGGLPPADSDVRTSLQKVRMSERLYRRTVRQSGADGPPLLEVF